MGDVNVYTTEGGTTYNLTCTTESDDIAYNQAMNQYYYDKAQYDQKVQEVNAKIEIIQVQDKNLELKLKQLDTEQNAIQTEMDAVKKVISKNVESSFKTFNA
jgi:septal ring factor EnvC (AmiA/AmiB activator)